MHLHLHCTLGRFETVHLEMHCFKATKRIHDQLQITLFFSSEVGLYTYHYFFIA